MSPIGDAFRSRLRKFPSLVNCCTIDWFQSWPADALQVPGNWSEALRPTRHITGRFEDALPSRALGSVLEQN